MRSLPIPKFNVENELYLKCLSLLRSNITKIDLYDDEGNDRMLYRNLHNQLDSYPKLKKLVIHAPTNEVNFKNAVHYLESIVNNNNLFSMQELVTASTSDPTYFRLFTTQRGTLLPTNTLDTMYLDVFSAVRTAPNEEFMLFIMGRFSNLKTLRCIEKNSSRRFPQFVSSESFAATLIQFIKYLSKIPQCQFPSIAMATANTIKLIEDFYVIIDKDEGSSMSSGRRFLFIAVSTFRQTSHSNFKGYSAFKIKNMIYPTKKHITDLNFITANTCTDLDLEQL